jgi:hypothetical protein
MTMQRTSIETLQIFAAEKGGKCISIEFINKTCFGNWECKNGHQWRAQHYEYPNHWHKTEQEFLDLQQRDKDKAVWAKNNKIQLIIIAFSNDCLDLEKYIQSKIEEM